MEIVKLPILIKNIFISFKKITNFTISIFGSRGRCQADSSAVCVRASAFGDARGKGGRTRRFLSAPSRAATACLAVAFPPHPAPLSPTYFHSGNAVRQASHPISTTLRALAPKLRPPPTLCMIKVEQGPPMEEKNATAEIWSMFKLP